MPLVVISQIRVYTTGDSTRQAKGEGVCYCLPMTRLILDLTIRKTISEPGMYSEFAKEMLNADHYVRTSSVRYELADVRLSTEAEPDPAQAYRIVTACRFPRLWCKAPAVNLSPQGFLHSLNMKPGKTPESQAVLNPGPTIDTGRPFPGSYLVNHSLLAKNTQADRVQDTGFLPFIRPVVKITQEVPLRDDALTALGRLAGIQESRQNLAGGFQEVAYEEGTIRLMFEELGRMEEAIVSKFTGTVRTEIQQVKVTVLPDRQGPHTYTLGYLDPAGGFRSDGGGTALLLTLDSVILPRKAAEPARQKQNRLGVVYRQPAHVSWRVSEGEKTKGSGSVLISQMGTMIRLPASRDKLRFCTETGSLLRTGR